jgi:thiol-disulfide isomerase/thioredoxin
MNDSTTRLARPLFAAILTALALSCGGAVQPASQAHALLGQAPEPATRPTLGGEVVEIPAPGKVTVLDFWATFCEPCLQEMPALEAWWQGADKSRVQVIGVSMDDDSYVVEQKLKELGITFPQLIDDGFVLKGRYLVDSVPSAFAIDREGKIRYFASAGSYRAAELIDVVESLMDR